MMVVGRLDCDYKNSSTPIVRDIKEVKRIRKNVLDSLDYDFKDTDFISTDNTGEKLNVSVGAIIGTKSYKRYNSQYIYLVVLDDELPKSKNFYIY